jgi:hypothetical protein
MAKELSNTDKSAREFVVSARATCCPGGAMHAIVGDTKYVVEIKPV